METLELCASQGPAVPFWIWSDYSLEWPEKLRSRSGCQRSKIILQIIYTLLMLSNSEGEIKEKMEGLGRGSKLGIEHRVIEVHMRAPLRDANYCMVAGGGNRNVAEL